MDHERRTSASAQSAALSSTRSRYGLNRLVAQNRAHIIPRLANTYPGSTTLASAPVAAVEMGMMVQAIRRRIENTRPCRSRGVWDCQIDCECAFKMGCIVAPRDAAAALRSRRGESTYTIWKMHAISIGGRTPHTR